MMVVRGKWKGMTPGWAGARPDWPERAEAGCGRGEGPKERDRVIPDIGPDHERKAQADRTRRAADMDLEAGGMGKVVKLGGARGDGRRL